MTPKVAKLEAKAADIRRAVLDMCCRAGTGHITSSFSCTEILVALYHGGILRFDPKQPHWQDRDRFILSKGQASVILYPVLADLGFFPASELERFAQEDGMFGVHLQHDVPGVEVTSGSLGHGLGIGTGMALAARMNRERHLVFVLLGDGECYEGSVWEAALFASHKRLNNLVAIVDRNFMAATGFTETMVELEPFEDKWRAFGWDVEVIDGHSIAQILQVFRRVRSLRSGRPLVVIADTVKGQGIPFMCYDPLCHAVTPGPERAAEARQALDEGMES